MPLTKAEIYHLHSRLLTKTRDFFNHQNFQEIVAQVLYDSVPLEPTIYPFQTSWQGGTESQLKWLSTSPEKSLKAALASGIKNCYAIGHSFRDLEQAGPLHKPEFLMLEWYRSNTDLKTIMKDVQNLVVELQAAVQSQNNISTSLEIKNWQTVSLATEFESLTGEALATKISDDSMRQFAEERGYLSQDATWEQLFNQWFLNELEPKLRDKPTFLIDFPARISPLCLKQPDKPYLAERFEVYLAGVEIGNGNVEKTDSAEVKQAFLTERNQRLKLGIVSPEVDEEFLASLDQLAGQKIAGIGLGLERLWMILAGTSQI